MEGEDAEANGQNGEIDLKGLWEKCRETVEWWKDTTEEI